MKLLIIDFETYWDNKYKLKNYPTPCYVADKRFKVLGMGYQCPGADAKFTVDVPAALHALQFQCGQNFEQCTVVCHNGYFDLFILNHVYGIRPSRVLDTMLLSYHVHGRKSREYGLMEGMGADLAGLSEYYHLPAKGETSDFKGIRELSPAQLAAMTAYATRDVANTAALVPLLADDVTNHLQEFDLINHTLQLYTTRYVHIDLAGLRALREEILKTVNDYLAAHGLEWATVGKNKSYIALLTDALKRTGRNLPMKPGKKKPIPATAKNDPAMQALCNDDDIIVSALALARVKRKSADQLTARLDKLEAIAVAMCELTGEVGRVPVHLVYFGAHTGRWAGGGGLNFQNMGRKGYGQRIRQLIVPAPGHRFVIGDLAAIEARVLAWLAWCPPLLELYKANGDPYAAFATKRFNTEVRKPKDTDPPATAARMALLRHAGKGAILGLGFGMGAVKHHCQLMANPDTAPLFSTGTLSAGKCAETVSLYRETYPEIPTLWRGVEHCFKSAIGATPVLGAQAHTNAPGLDFTRAGDVVLVTLPSGRALRYTKARLETKEKTIKYMKADGIERKFTTKDTQIVYGNGSDLYGGKITENVVQAIARDILAAAVLQLEAAGYRVAFHCHDEIVLQVPTNDAELASMVLEAALTQPPTWATGLPLGAEVSVSERYNK